MRVWLARLAIGVALVVAAGCEHATAPAGPARIRVTAASVGTVGTAVSPSPTFAVVDSRGTPIPNVAVTVSVGSGGGTLSGAPTTSGAGDTPVGSWVLGPDPGPNTLIVTAAGVPSGTVTVDARKPYGIDLRFYGPPVSAAMVNAFEAARTRIEAMVTADIPDVTTGNWDSSLCGVTGGGVLALPIDDIIIFAAVDSIDGPGKILGSAGPCFIRQNAGLPLVSTMHFDKADLQGLVNDGRINDVILHEMLHALGVGTMWAIKNLSKYTKTDSSTYIGLNAINGCQFHGGGVGCASAVPLETTGGDGTRDVHWREATSSAGIGFGVELMTGYVSPAGTHNPLSRITIGALADLGYTVDYNQADPYTVPGSVAAALYADIATAQGHGGFQINERLLEPVATLDANGRVVRIFR